MELLTVEEAAAILKLSPFTVRRLLRAGDLPGVKAGKREWRIGKDDLEAYLRGNQTGQGKEGQP